MLNVSLDREQGGCSAANVAHSSSEKRVSNVR
jgi:hypothetical protein